MKTLPDLTPEEEAEELTKEIYWAADCITGSSLLKAALEKAFADFEKQYGLKPGEGRTLLLDTGVRL